MLKKPKIPSSEKTTQLACDTIIARAVVKMVVEAGAPIPLVIDRLLTYAAGQAATMRGSAVTADHLRRFADNIDRGLFWSITGEDKCGGRSN
ncbi:hypothetical protein [Sinorhizobium sp. M4_45]|uniref:hypothetical protein n=1 Tax=Sinorhizobium sp. M4_45 TaxID=2037901 RepID=UPI000C99B186|nr:hypothetical protein [Sinorhizobium sp. M4_45]PND26786.1 hypothetical protein CN933_13650 [Sinorhizobium sp. M4_45]